MGGLYDGESRLSLQKNEIWLPSFGVCNINNNGKTLRYNTDWNWLIEVVDKCSLKAEELNVDSLFRAELWMFVTNDITAVYNSCIDFIKWYNENYAGTKN